jgi:hypothetical protein
MLHLFAVAHGPDNVRHVLQKLHQGPCIQWYAVRCLAGYLHTLRVPAASLRLAAGVQPSLALFATLEQWMQQPTWETLALMLATLLAAVQALLEPGAPGGLGCSQQGPGSAAAGAAAGSTSATRSTISGCGSCSRRAASISISVSSSAGDRTTTSPTSSSSSSSSSSSNSSSGNDSLPGVLEAVSSATLAASKLLMRVGPLFCSSAGEHCIAREVVVLGARLCNAVLQLALQQCVRYQKQPLEQLHISKGALQLLEASQRLLGCAAAAGFAEVQQQLSYPVGSSSVLEATTQGVTSWMTGQERMGSTQLLFLLLHTGFVRLFALQSAASEVASLAQWRQQAMQQAAAESRGRAFTVAFSAAAAGEVQGCVCDSAAGGVTPWCPAHNSSPVPEATEQIPGLSEQQLISRIAVIANSVTPRVRTPMLVGCSCHGCPGPAGVNAAEPAVNRRGVVCSGCGMARYCCPQHAQAAWPAHRKVCGRLAAALGRRPAGGSGSGSSTAAGPRTGTGSAGGRSQAPGGTSTLPQGRHYSDAQVQSLCFPKSAGPGSARSSRSSSAGAAPVRDQGQEGACRVCAWCGKASQQLLRCARCKAAWYCGADHQRAAWKAGHKQECAAVVAAAAAAAGANHCPRT